MNSEDIKSYLSNIEESLFDEQKIVTYSWLSRTLGIHCNVSKQLLFMFFEKCPKKDELSVTYLLIGKPNEGDSCQVLVVKDKDLESAEKGFKTITSKHIYSIQKCQDLSDLNVLYTPPNDEGIPDGVSAVNFTRKERDNAMIAKLRQNALPSSPAQPVPTKKPPPPAVKSPIKSKEEKQPKLTEQETKSDSTSDVKKPVVPSMFNNMSAARKKQPAKAAVKGKKPQQGINTFFTKTANKPATNNETKKELPTVDNTSKKEEITVDRLSPLKENKATLNIQKEEENLNKKEESPLEKKSGSPQESSIKQKKSEPKPKSASKSVKNKGSSKKKPVNKKDNQKKRKRLVVLSDSDSNNSSEEEQEEEVHREPTPEPQPTVIPDDDMDDVVMGTPEPSKKRKKRTLVSKTFKDPDGFMVTKKQYEEVSASDDDEDVIPEKKFKEDTKEKVSDVKATNKQNKVSPKNTKSSPQKVKQSSLMSFFKKK